MRKGIKGDFVFIAAYWLFFIALSALLVQRGLALGVWLALAVAFCAVLAAICATTAAQMDFLENLRLYALLDTPSDAPDTEIQRRIDDVRDAARFKFRLIFVATAALSPVFLWHAGWWLFGLWRHRAAVDWAFFLMLFGVLAIAAAFNFIPRESLMSVLAGS
jgi:hypothetical protein